MFFKSTQELSSYCQKEDIINLDFRFINNENILNSFSVSPDILESTYKDKFTFLVEEKLNFIKDPFLPHTSIYTTVNKLFAHGIIDYIKRIKIKFTFSDNVNALAFGLADSDEGRNLRSEIILALKEVGILAIANYVDEDLSNCLIFDKLDNLQNLEVKYCINMIAKSYNLSVSNIYF